MQAPHSAADDTVEQIARRHGFSTDATLVMRDAVANGHGTMAQFRHPEFGGSGQWMRGGMTMVADMFDQRMKGRVDALCSDLAALVANSGGRGGAADASSPGSTPRGTWWPAALGAPNASGSQNGMRYAYFAAPCRLAIDRGDGQVRLYDTQDHRIGGVSQQQSSTGSLTFSSQHGPVDVSRLPVVEDAGWRSPVEASRPEPTSAPRSDPPSAAAAPMRSGLAQGHDAVFAAIEQLAALHAKGIVSADEFASKKAELLRRV